MSHPEDALTGALIGLARAAHNEPEITPEVYSVLIRGLYLPLTHARADQAALSSLYDEARAQKAILVPGCMNCASPCDRSADYDPARLYGDPDAEIAAQKSLLLCALRTIAADACHALRLGRTDNALAAFLMKGLVALGGEWRGDELLPLLREAASMTLAARRLCTPSHS